MRVSWFSCVVTVGTYTQPAGPARGADPGAVAVAQQRRGRHGLVPRARGGGGRGGAVRGRGAGGRGHGAAQAHRPPLPALRHPAQRRRQAHQRERLPGRVSAYPTHAHTRTRIYVHTYTRVHASTHVYANTLANAHAMTL